MTGACGPYNLGGSATTRPSSSLSTTIVVPTTVEVVAMYCIMSSSFFGGVRTGEEVRYALSFLKASLASSVYSNLCVFFSSLKKGNPFRRVLI